MQGFIGPQQLLKFWTPLFCVAAELGHLKCDHGLWLTIANVLASGTVSLLPVISGKSPGHTLADLELF